MGQVVVLYLSGHLPANKSQDTTEQKLWRQNGRGSKQQIKNVWQCANQLTNQMTF